MKNAFDKYKQLALLPIILFFVMFFLSTTVGAAGKPTWEEANAAYNAGTYRTAIKAYEGLIPQHKKDPALYFNLANAYFKKGDLGPAIYNYERALLLAPRSLDIRKNLASVKLQRRVPQPDNRYPFLRWLMDKASYLRRGEWIALTLFLYCAYLAFEILRLYQPRAIFVTARHFILFFFLISLLSLGLKWYDTYQPSAIILVNSTEVRFGPAQQEKVAFILPEGLKVKVAQKQKGWYRIQLADPSTGLLGSLRAGLSTEIRTGWVEAKSLGLIQTI